MSVHALAPHFQGFDLTRRLAALAEDVAIVLRRRRTLRTVESELRSFTPAELSELGISTPDIDFVAADAARHQS